MPSTITKLIQESFKKEGLVSFNSSKTEFCFSKKLGKNQRQLVEKYLKSDYQKVEIDGVLWEVKASFHWCDQMPVSFYGNCH